MSAHTFNGSSVDFSEVAGSPNAVLAAAVLLNADPSKSLGQVVAEHNALGALKGMNLPGLTVTTPTDFGDIIPNAPARAAVVSPEREQGNSRRDDGFTR